MYDTIKLWLGKDSVSNTNLLAEIPLYLSGIKEQYGEIGTSISGNLRNLKVYIKEAGISIIGSWPKYFLNDNIKTLLRSDVPHVIEQISDEIHLPIINAKANRIDIAQNFPVKYKPESYFDYLGNCRYFKRLIQPNSLYYKNSQRLMTFYNKVREAKKKGLIIPDILLNSNLLRYEYRINQRLPKRFKRAEIKAKDLSEESFYIQLIDQYVKEYENIIKLKKLNFDYNNMESPKDFWKQMDALLIQKIGYNETMEIVENMRARNVFQNKEYYSRLKKEIRDRCNMPEITESSEFIEELDNKIKMVKSNYR